MVGLKTEKVRNRNHRMFIASLQCCVTGIEGHTQCSHIRTGNDAGMGLKSGDDSCVPLSYEEHDKQHRTSEKLYWKDSLDDAQRLAKDLYENTSNYKKCHDLVSKFRDKLLWKRFPA